MLAVNGVVDLRRHFDAHVEPRLGFVLARSLAEPLTSGSELLAATESVLPCLEIVDRRFDGAPVANDVARLHMGEAVPPPADGHLRRLRVQLYADGALWAPPGVRTRLLVPPLAAAAWLANEMLRSGHHPEPGTLLICPVVIGRLELLAGLRVIGHFGGLGSVELEVHGLHPSGAPASSGVGGDRQGPEPDPDRSEWVGMPPPGGTRSFGRHEGVRRSIRYAASDRRCEG
jgi:2-oxo-3-hexenedioate decarboxylase